jgi:glutamyl-Q tRNA(Asp) synthetase
MSNITRFAPSPTGYLHLGHAYSALFSAHAAGDGTGTFNLRIEDIDKGRCRDSFEQAIYEDLAWLGLNWQEPVRRQSEHMGDYQKCLEHLQDLRLLYPCFCTRSEIAAEISAAGHAPHGPDGPLYPGTCRHLSENERSERKDRGTSFALRLDMAAALDQAGQLHWQDLDKGEIKAEPEIFGDVVLARKDTPSSYHLAVTHDDDLQGITLVTRGDDLFEATHVHRLLQNLLGFDTPRYHHHHLLTDEHGRRFAKRDKALTLNQLRQSGKTPEDVFGMIGWDNAK